MASRVRRTRLATTAARADLASAVNRVVFGDERIVLKRHGKDFAAIVSLADLQRLEELEDAYWTKAADKALADAKRRGQRPLPFDQVERRLDAAKRRRRGANDLPDEQPGVQATDLALRGAALAAVRGAAQDRIRAEIRELTDDPTPPGSISMQGKASGLYRIRVGAWRVVYRVQSLKRTVLVIRIGHRSEVYRGYERP